MNVALTDADRWRTLFGGGATANSGVQVSHRSAVGYPPLWRAINLISNDVAGLPLDVYRREDNNGREIAKGHPVQRLVKVRANAAMRACVFRKTLTAHALMFGNGFAYIERDQRMRPIALWPLDPQGVIIRYMHEDDALWYATYIDGEAVKFPSMDVLHVKGLSHDGIRGYSVLDIMRDALGVGMAAQDFGGRFFGQGSNMSGLLMIPGSFSDEKIRNTMAAWDSMNAGLKNSHKVGLLQDGVRFQQLTVDPDAAQFLETRQFEVRATVANIVGVPPHMLGDDTRTSHSSLEQENLSYLSRSLNPWLKEWESECHDKLLSEREKDRETHFLEFNREAEIQMVFADKIDGIYRQMEMGLLNANEGRRMLNLPDLGAAGEVRYVPANWLRAGETPPQTAQPGESGDKSQQDTSEPSEDRAQPEALRQMVTAAVEQATTIESDRVIQAAKTKRNFVEWLDTFYAQWAQNSVRGLGGEAVDSVKTSHAEQSKRDLLRIAGSSTHATLQANVTTLTQQWKPRAAELVDRILEAI